MARYNVIDDKSDKPTLSEIPTIAGAEITGNARKRLPIPEVLSAFQKVFNTFHETVGDQTLWTRVYGIMKKYSDWTEQEIDGLTVIETFNNFQYVVHHSNIYADRMREIEHRIELSTQPRSRRTYVQGDLDAHGNWNHAANSQPAKEEEKGKSIEKTAPNKTSPGTKKALWPRYVCAGGVIAVLTIAAFLLVNTYGEGANFPRKVQNSTVILPIYGGAVLIILGLLFGKDIIRKIWPF
jgi:hypothetical protein